MAELSATPSAAQYPSYWARTVWLAVWVVDDGRTARLVIISGTMAHVYRFRHRNLHVVDTVGHPAATVAQVLVFGQELAVKSSSQERTIFTKWPEPLGPRCLTVVGKFVCLDEMLPTKTRSDLF